ncbi:hypothetical protein [Cellvibrio sp.]
MIASGYFISDQLVGSALELAGE